MFIYNETATEVIHFDSLSLKLTVEHAPTSYTVYYSVLQKSQFIIQMLTPALSVDFRLIYDL